MERKEVSRLFSAFNNYKVIVIGDVMIDTYLWGRVERISPEAPVPVVTSRKSENRLGGAANVALNVQALGATPVLCTIVGNDQKADVFLNLLRKKKLPVEGILKHKSRLTTVKTRIISSNQQMLRLDEEITENIAPELELIFVEHVEQLIQKNKIDAIIFEDYDKGVITPTIINHIVLIAKKHGILTAVDPKKRNFSAYKNVTLFKPNFKELVEGVKQEINKKDVEKINEAAKALRRELNAEYILVTLSELGIFINTKNYYHRIPAEIRHIADVSGAGDTVISMATLCLIFGVQPTQMAILSNLAGGLVCERVGAVPVDKKQLYDESIAYFSA